MARPRTTAICGGMVMVAVTLAWPGWGEGSTVYSAAVGPAPGFGPVYQQLENNPAGVSARFEVINTSTRSSTSDPSGSIVIDSVTVSIAYVSDDAKDRINNPTFNFDLATGATLTLGPPQLGTSREDFSIHVDAIDTSGLPPDSDFGVWTLVTDVRFHGVDEPATTRRQASVNGFVTIYVLDPGASIPEPSSLVLLGLGALGVVGCGWRRRMHAAA